MLMVPTCAAVTFGYGWRPHVCRWQLQVVGAHVCGRGN